MDVAHGGRDLSDELLARLRQRDASRRPVEEPDAERALQLSDRIAERGGRNPSSSAAVRNFPRRATIRTASNSARLFNAIVPDFVMKRSTLSRLSRDMSIATLLTSHV